MNNTKVTSGCWICSLPCLVEGFRSYPCVQHCVTGSSKLLCWTDRQQMLQNSAARKQVKEGGACKRHSKALEAFEPNMLTSREMCTIVNVPVVAHGDILLLTHASLHSWSPQEQTTNGRLLSQAE